MHTISSDLSEQLEQHFGWASFRPGQQEVIETVLGGRDCLCVMPTGGGKSLCYQLPALVQPGVALVISPLIALMQDQVDQLCAQGIRATYINSSLDPAQQHARISEMPTGAYDLVYIAPERFRSRKFCDALADTPLALLAIDEAHCISEWGHDFRPDYMRLGRVRERLGRPVTIALTATATDRVRRDIVEQLQLGDPKVFITGFDRPNLDYECIRVGGNAQKEQHLKDFLSQIPGSGIVYAATRKRCEEVAELVAETGRSCVVYHAGMMPHDRRHAQEQFMSGRRQIAVATNAFGMGIDKPDIRFVVHYNLPGTVEAYYQEAGRAGRDSNPARCLLLYAPSDRFIQEFFIESEYPSREIVGEIYRFLCDQKSVPIELTQQEIKERLDLKTSESAVGVSLRLLQSAGVLERLVPKENMAWVRIAASGQSLVEKLSANAQVRRRVLLALEELVGRSSTEEAYFHPDRLAGQLGITREALVRALRWLTENLPVEYVPPFRGQAVRMLDRTKPFEQLSVDFETLDRRRAAEYEKLDEVISYAKTRTCRRATILRYFGDGTAVQCGNCDNCYASGAVAPRSSSETVAETANAHLQDTFTEPRDEQRVSEFLKKVLSGVARAGGRVGKGAVAAMLTGSASQKVQRTRLDQLSTFGLLSEFRQADVAEAIDRAILAGYVQQEEVERFRPVVKITPKGWEVMIGERSPEPPIQFPAQLLDTIHGRQAKDVRTNDSGAPPQPLSPEASDVLRELRSLRDRIAQQARLPLHYIFTNETMEELARHRPQSEEQLLKVKGIGPKKVLRYGRELLEVLGADPISVKRNPNAEQSAASHLPPSKGAGPVDASPDETPAYFWTWRLLQRGFNPNECAQIRDLNPGEVALHALGAARDGKHVQLDWLLSAAQIEAIAKLVGTSPPASIHDLLDRLPSGIRHEHVQLYLLLQGPSRPSD